jgi:hypothetical protein
MSNKERYAAVAGSKSGHCCFEATVWDTEKPLMIGGQHYESKGVFEFETVCECFDMEQALRVAEALNALSRPIFKTHVVGAFADRVFLKEHLTEQNTRKQGGQP